MKQKYGVLSYENSRFANIGDEIQSIASSRFLPKIDSYIQREKISKFSSNENHKLIMNAWWMHNPAKFPPSDAIEPLLISMHFVPSKEKKLFSNESIDFLRKNGPVGCRDMCSLELCKKYNIAAYFSGCLTTTLQKNPEIKREDYILAVNVPKRVVREIRKRTSRPVYTISKMLWLPKNAEARMEIGKKMLILYHKAHAVITTNLHTVLPCIAFETPVLFVNKEKTNHYDIKQRITGISEVFNCINMKDLLKNKDAYNFDTPPKNPDTYLEMKNNLIKKCQEFTNFNNEQPVINESSETVQAIIKKLKRFI